MHKLIPFALKAVGLMGAAGGSVLGAVGANDIAMSNDRIEEAAKAYDEVYQELKVHEVRVNAALTNLGDWQEYALLVVVERMIAFLKRHDKQVSENEKLLADGLEAAPGRVSLMKAKAKNPLDWARMALGSALTGVSVKLGLTKLMTHLGKASTGTAISSLHGAAKTRTILSAFGGGSKASGGGGMASGETALKLVTVGPAILVVGLFTAGQGQRAKTRAAEAERISHIEIAKLQATRPVFDAVITRSFELWQLLNDLILRATAALDLLESEPFDPKEHTVRIQQALHLATAVKDVATTPVVDDRGEVSEESSELKIKYRSFNKETGNV